MSVINYDEQDEEVHVDVFPTSEDLLSKLFTIVMVGVIGVILMMILMGGY